MPNRQDIGRWGEKQAEQYLREHGYEVLAKNVRTAYGEIDLIARQADCLTFVEVKTRRTNSLGPPEVSVSARKRHHMQAAARAYVHGLGNPPESWVIDVISVQKIDGGGIEIIHFQNALGEEQG